MDRPCAHSAPLQPSPALCVAAKHKWRPVTDQIGAMNCKICDKCGKSVIYYEAEPVYRE